MIITETLENGGGLGFTAAADEGSGLVVVAASGTGVFLGGGCGTATEGDTTGGGGLAHARGARDGAGDCSKG